MLSSSLPGCSDRISVNADDLETLPLPGTGPEQSRQFHRYAVRQSVLVQVQCDEPLPERRRGDVVLQLVINRNRIEIEGVDLGPSVIEAACRNGTESG